MNETSTPKAIVTGGSKGIGKAIAERLMQEGFTVAICARGLKPLQAMKDKWGSQLHIQSASVAERFGAYSFARESMAKLGGIDLLVNNAGAFSPDPIFTQVDGQMEELMNANFYSMFYVSKAVVPKMKEQGHGHIINMGSVAGLQAYPAGGLYTISKFAVNGFTKAMRQELLDTNIRVTHVAPGATLTSSWEGTDLPEERFMKAEDIAEAVYSAWLMSKQTVVEEIVLRPQKGDI